MEWTPALRQQMDALPDYHSWPLWKLEEQADLLQSNLQNVQYNQDRRNRIERELSHIVFEFGERLQENPAQILRPEVA